MITFHVESFRAGVPEIKKLIVGHWDELALNKDEVPLDPMWEVYFQREDRGEVLFIAARDAGEMVGYFIGFIAPGLHYRTCLTCTMDIFYVRPDKRTGSAGIRLFKFMEEEVKRRGVRRLFVGAKLKADASPLFERLKYERVEVYYSKWLGK